MEVYIVFGDTPRSDGDNIQGIFFSRRKAEEYMNGLEEMDCSGNSYSIEEHDVEMS